MLSGVWFIDGGPYKGLISDDTVADDAAGIGGRGPKAVLRRCKSYDQPWRCIVLMRESGLSFPRATVDLWARRALAGIPDSCWANPARARRYLNNEIRRVRAKAR